MLPCLNNHEAAVLDHAPRAALVPPGEAEEHGERGHHLEAHELALVSLGLGGPREEYAHVLGHLRDRGRRAILVLDGALVDRLRHADPAAGEVGVVVLGVARLQASGHVLVAGEQGKDVVSTADTSLGDQREIRRVGAVVSEAGGLLVRVGRGEVVGQLARAVEHLALVVGPVSELNILGHRLRLLLRVADADQVAVGDGAEAVA
mmetsp:Transcript_54628/g.130934  ORF Transcript_54628/g.130934 Transcript_54628/m.130934 type:complete len:205 (+) Transcript_54628:344-958(+)